MSTEHVLYGVRKGEPAWKEVILSTNPAMFPKIRKMARRDGFTRMRVARIDLSSPPDFTKTINKKALSKKGNCLDKCLKILS
jgi:hypothetical protein